MPTKVTKESIPRIVDEGAQILDPLPEAEYAEEHLPGAINVPLARLNRETTAHLPKDRPTIVYCYDLESDISPRAAARLESLGFTEVFDYFPGKADWAVSGLPMEGRRAGRRRAIQVARKDVPTCRAEERLGDVRGRVLETGKDVCIVVNDEGVVAGRLESRAWEADAGARVEDVMELDPPTVRPDALVRDIVERLQESRTGSLLVTSHGSHRGGRLLGVLFRDDAERALAVNAKPEP